MWQMAVGWRYRVASIGGTAVLAGAAIVIANLQAVQVFVTSIPPLANHPVNTLSHGDFIVAATTAVAITLLSYLPLVKPHSRRSPDTLWLAVRQLFIAVVVLAAVGYFDYTYRLPRSTLISFSVLLALVLPLWFLIIQPRTGDRAGRAIVVGDDLGDLQSIIEASDTPVVGYVSPSVGTQQVRQSLAESTDGGEPGAQNTELEWLGGLSRLDQVLLDNDIDTAILSFSRPDRAEFFGVLATCYECNTNAKVPRSHADTVLLTGFSGDDLVDIDLDPWDWQDRMLKRGFDILFAIGGLLLLSPVILVIAAMIKAEDGGSVLYRQKRTATFGRTFTLRKFRSMRIKGENTEPSPHGDHDDRVTTTGRYLRDTHLDEIPQLWSILVGDMSVVGPRAIWTEEEKLLETEADSWRKRWFIKPGLTGLAQINRASSADPEAKLQYDIEYIRRQSLWLDLKIVARQLLIVGQRVAAVLRGRERNSKR